MSLSTLLRRRDGGIQEMDDFNSQGAHQIERWASLLFERGWCVIPSLLSPRTITALDADLSRDFAETPFCQGGFYGHRTKRFGRLLVRSPIARDLAQHELVLGVVKRVLSPWCDCIQLNLTQALALLTHGKIVQIGTPKEFMASTVPEVREFLERDFGNVTFAA